MQELSLKMTFKNTSGKNSYITLKNVGAEITKEQIQSAMDIVIANDLFVTPLGGLTEVVSAELIDKTTTDILK